MAATLEDQERLKSWVGSFARQALDGAGLPKWQVTWDRARRRAGACDHTRRTLSFSSVLLPLYPEPVVRDVVLHEVAHALAGARAGHGPKWKRVAANLGASPKAQLPGWLPQPLARWVGTCPACGAERRLHRRPTRVSACASCSPTFNFDYAHQWTLDGRPTVPPGRFAVELARLTRRDDSGS